MQCNSKRHQSDAYVNRQTIKNQHRWTTNPEHSTKSQHWPSPTILVHKHTCNNPTFLNEAKHLLIKIALFFKSIVLMKQHIVARSKVSWINRPNQIGKVEAYRLCTRRVWNIHAFACVCACAGMLSKRVFDRCMRGPELKSWKTACVVVIGREVTALTDSSGANSDQGHDWWKQRVGWRRGTPANLGWGGNDNGPKKEMKRTAAFRKHAVRRIWLQKRK